MTDPTLRDNVNDLVDRFERGELSRRDLFRAAAALGVLSSGLGSWVDAAAQPGPAKAARADLRRTGFLAQVRKVDAASGNNIAGVIKPGALRFWQQIAAGEWQHRTVSGEGVIEIDGQPTKVPAGQNLVIPAGKRFTYLNEGKAAWTFEASHPFWQPSTFTYGLDKAQLHGDEVWFDVCRSPEAVGSGGFYRIVTAEKAKNYAVISLDPGQQTVGMRSTTGVSRLTAVAGDVAIEKRGGTAAMSLSRGKGVALGRDESFRAANHGKAPAILELRPDPPRTWTPEAILWDFGNAEVKGDAIWFELVLPL